MSSGSYIVERSDFEFEDVITMTAYSTLSRAKVLR